LSRVDAAMLDDLRARAGRGEIAWAHFRPGVEIHRLWGDPAGASAALLRYRPGAGVPRHLHEGEEHVYVLEGAQRDDHGVHAAGTEVVNLAGSIHTVDSPDGCVVLVVWDRPVRFLETSTSEPSDGFRASRDGLGPAEPDLPRRDTSDSD
jgi:anti-sigma factor ChrR (cupin superfamily)